MKLLKHEKAFWADFRTHLPFICKGEPCVVHNPSDHHMRTWPLNYRLDIGITERICPHGVGHPDPDCSRSGERSNNREHGCDGCCIKFKRVAKRKTHPEIKGRIAG